MPWPSPPKRPAGIQTLSQDPDLRQWPLTLYPFNPRVAEGFKRAYIDLDKTDPSDAGVIADRLRFGRDLPALAGRYRLYLPLVWGRGR